MGKIISIEKNEDFKNKPYNICLECSYLGKSCDGPNFLGMTYKRWVEWCNIRKRQLNLTNATIAELSGIPKGTIDTIFSGRSDDIRFSTMQAITKVLVGGCWGQYPCHYAASHIGGEETPETTMQKMQVELDQAKQELRDLKQGSELSAYKADDAQKKVDYLKQQIRFKEIAIEDFRTSIRKKEKVILTLGIAFGVLAIGLIVMFAIDAFVPDAGWFRF